MTQPQSVDELLGYGKEQLLALDVPLTIQFLNQLTDVEEVYSAHVVLMVAMDLKRIEQGREYTREDFSYLEQLGETTRVYTEDNKLWVYWKHPSRDHCIILDFMDGIYVGGGTSVYAQSIKSIEAYLENTKDSAKHG